jgi:hypothetical protein
LIVLRKTRAVRHLSRPVAAAGIYHSVMPCRIHFFSLTRPVRGIFEPGVRQAETTFLMRQPLFKRTTGPVRGRANIFVLVLVFLVLAAGAFWYYRHGREHGTIGMIGGAGGVVLSDSTKTVLKNLNSPVEIRFHSLLDQASVPAATFAFADRINQLLAGFQQVAGGKITVIRHNSLSDADAASADGIKPFNLDKGSACFLGLTVVSGGQKESLPQIQPEWEPALEFDLARAILHVTAAPANSVVHASAPVSSEVTNEIVRLIPDVKGTSLEDGTRILREATLKEFTAAGIEMEGRLKIAQQQLSDAQNGQSAAEQQAAMKQLQEVQLEQGEKYKQIAARLQDQLAVFQQMKTVPPAAK